MLIDKGLNRDEFNEELLTISFFDDTIELKKPNNTRIHVYKRI